MRSLRNRDTYRRHYLCTSTPLRHSVRCNAHVQGYRFPCPEFPAPAPFPHPPPGKLTRFDAGMYVSSSSSLPLSLESSFFFHFRRWLLPTGRACWVRAMGAPCRSSTYLLPLACDNCAYCSADMSTGILLLSSSVSCFRCPFACRCCVRRAAPPAEPAAAASFSAFTSFVYAAGVRCSWPETTRAHTHTFRTCARACKGASVCARARGSSL